VCVDDYDADIDATDVTKLSEQNRQELLDILTDAIKDTKSVDEAVKVLRGFGGGTASVNDPDEVSCQTESFVQRASRLCNQGRTTSGLDLLYNSVDELLHQGKFAQLNSMIERVSVDDHSIDILLGMLTTTLPASSRLPARSQFFNDVERSIRNRGEYEDGLLTGLEGCQPDGSRS